MLIKQIYADNSYRNFNYLIACPDTGEALAIDPLVADRCLAVAKENGWTIKQILNTHEHFDHIDGNEAVIAKTGAKVLAHKNALTTIPNVSRGLVAGDIIKVGNLSLDVLDTPGHTKAHVCIYSSAEQPALFCGDTLFNAGAGNCHNGGDPELLYHTFVDQLAQLPDNTRIYPGHDYLINNLQFTLDREPDNQQAQALLEQHKDVDPHNAPVTTLGLEKEINTFFRLQQPTLIAKLHERFPELPPQPTAKQVFVKLRELRNQW